MVRTSISAARSAHGLDEFVPRLPQTDHQAGLGRHRMTDADRQAAAGGQDRHAAVPSRAAADRSLEAGDGFDVVVQDLRLRPDHGPDVVLATVQVTDEHLDARPRARQADLSHRVGHDAGAAIGQVIASDHGHHRA